MSGTLRDWVRCIRWFESCNAVTGLSAVLLRSLHKVLIVFDASGLVGRVVRRLVPTNARKGFQAGLVSMKKQAFRPP